MAKLIRGSPEKLNLTCFRVTIHVSSEAYPLGSDARWLFYALTQQITPIERRFLMSHIVQIRTEVRDEAAVQALSLIHI